MCKSDGGVCEPSLSSFFNGLRDANASAKPTWGKLGNARLCSGLIFMLKVEFINHICTVILGSIPLCFM